MKRETFILLLLKHMGFINGRVQLQKLLFLLEKNYKLSTGYYFVPYRYGPYAEAIQHDLDRLVEYGYVEHGIVKKANNETLHRYCLTEYGEQFLLEHEINPFYEEVIQDLCQDFQRYSLLQLIEYVYEHYPEYTINSEIKDRFSHENIPPEDFISADHLLKKKRVLKPSFVNWLEDEIKKISERLEVSPIKMENSEEEEVDDLIIEMLYIAYEDIIELSQEISTELLVEDFTEAGSINNKLSFIVDMIELLLKNIEEGDIVGVYTEFANIKTNLQMLDEEIGLHRANLKAKLVTKLFRFIEDVTYLLDSINQLYSR